MRQIQTFIAVLGSALLLASCQTEVVHSVSFTMPPATTCSEAGPINYFRAELYTVVEGQAGCLSCLGSGSRCILQEPVCVCGAVDGLAPTSLNRVLSDVVFADIDPSEDYCLRVLGTTIEAAQDQPVGECPCAGDGSVDADAYSFDSSASAMCGTHGTKFSITGTMMLSRGDTDVVLSAYCAGDSEFATCSASQ